MNNNIQKITEPLKSKLFPLSLLHQYFDVFIGFDQIPGNYEYNLVYDADGFNIEMYHHVNAISATISREGIIYLSSKPEVIYIEEIAIEKDNLYKIHYQYDTERIINLAQTSWGINKIRAPQVHNLGITGKDIKVSVMDSGIDYNHPDLKNNYKGGYNFINNTNNPFDGYGHGTLVSGVIGANGDMVGVAPECDLYALKILRDDGTGSGQYIAATEWTIDNKMDIINMSFSLSGDSITFHNLLNKAYNNGILPIASSGNGGKIEDSCTTNSIGYPALYNSVISVGSTEEDDSLAQYSSRGSKLDLTAPGGYIWTTQSGGGYKYASGTSLSCPHVVGLAALIKSKNNNYSPDYIRDSLIEGAIDYGSPRYDGCFGYGRIDAINSITNVQDCLKLSVNIINCMTSLTQGSTEYFTVSITDGTPPYNYKWYVIRPDNVIEYPSTGSILEYTFTQVGTYNIAILVVDSCLYGAKNAVNICTVNATGYETIPIPSLDKCPNGTFYDPLGSGKCYPQKYILYSGLGAIMLLYLKKSK